MSDAVGVPPTYGLVVTLSRALLEDAGFDPIEYARQQAQGRLKLEAPWLRVGELRLHAQQFVKWIGGEIGWAPAAVGEDWEASQHVFKFATVRADAN